MMNLLKFFPSRTSFEINEWKKTFFSHPHHQWMQKHPSFLWAINQLFKSMKIEHWALMAKTSPFLILPSVEEYACTVTPEHKERMILIFPQLLKLLQSGHRLQGVAILAHELGHILSPRRPGSEWLESQVEADQFAFECGFGEELISLLESYPSNIEISVRLSYLTSRKMKALLDH